MGLIKDIGTIVKYTHQLARFCCKKELNGKLGLTAGVAWKEKQADNPNRRKSMARRNPRPEATQTQTLTPLKMHCEQCGQPLSVSNHGHRSVATLSGQWRLTLVIRQCIQSDCPNYHKRQRPEEEGRWALPHGDFGLDIIALIGQWRFRGLCCKKKADLSE
jgi:hypothetical protein